MSMQLLPLIKLSICTCGFTTLNDDIPLGAIYPVIPETVRGGFGYKCGGCGTIFPDIEYVQTGPRDIGTGAFSPGPLRYLPAALFGLSKNVPHVN